MEIIGKIIVALPEQSGTSRAGNVWKKREYVLETIENFPKKVHFDFFGERADQYPLNVGDVIKLSFDIESREYAADPSKPARWFTSIRGWKAEPATAPVAAQPSYAAPAAPAYSAPAPAPAYGAPAAPPTVAPAAGSPTDDLPF